MEIKQFEQMIRCSILSLSYTLPIFLRFHVTFRAKTGRIQTDVLAFGRDEFEEMTVESAWQHIRACESRLEQASRTKYGRLNDEGGNTKIVVHEKKVTVQVKSAINYPAH